MTKISQLAIDRIKNNNDVKALLMLKFKKTARAIEYWILKRSFILTTPDAVEIIMTQTGLAEHEILVEENRNA